MKFQFQYLNIKLILIFSTFLNGQSQDICIHVLEDDSGYFTSGKDSSNRANICKYIFSTPSTASCQQLPSFQSFAYGQLRISSSTFFLLSNDASPTTLHFSLISFGSTSPIWSYKLLCSTGSCTAKSSSAVLADGYIYSFFSYGNTKYLYFANFKETDGTVGQLRYKSSTGCNNVYGLAMNEGFIVSSACSTHLLIYNRASQSFTILVFSGNEINMCSVESSGRFLVVGFKSPYGYITKFMPQSIDSLPDFSAASWTMDLLPSSTEEITLETGQTIGAITSQSVTAKIYSITFPTYIQGSTYTSDINYQTNDQYYSILEGSTSLVTLDLTCSISSSTAISFSIGNYLTNTVPQWVSINSSTGMLTIVAPDVTTDTDLYFYINSVMVGVTGTPQKLVKITVLNCAPTNCLKCVNTK